MWVGVACGCGMSVGEFKNLVLKYYSDGEMFLNLIILKVSGFDFLRSLAPIHQNHHKMRYGRKKFRTLNVLSRKF
jgi:hypothetical protein